MSSGAAASSTSDRRLSRREQAEIAEDNALLTLNTLLHGLVGTTITVELCSDVTVCGELTRADNHMKYAC